LFGKKYTNSTPEKFTTSRIHFYFKESEDVQNDCLNMIEMVVLANRLSSYFFNIGKYNQMIKFQIGSGMDYGDFTEFKFQDDDSEIVEMTTIGSPANRAAKLQSKCGDGKIIISDKVYDLLPSYIKRAFFKTVDISKFVAKKYDSLTAYESSVEYVVGVLGEEYLIKEREIFASAKETANKTDFKDINFVDARAQIDFSELSSVHPKDIDPAVVLYSDIRGFTNKVDHGRLSEMKELTQKVLQSMYSAVKQEDGTHVQFQGDRESAIFNKETNSGDFAIRSIFCAMRMLEKIDKINESGLYSKVDIGIGCALGRVFATRIGLRGEKFNVILSETVTEADKTEDEVAGVGSCNPKTEIAITKDLYEYISKMHTSQSNTIKEIFTERIVDGKKYYVTTMRLSKYRQQLDKKQQDKNAREAKNNNGIKPWGVYRVDF